VKVRRLVAALVLGALASAAVVYVSEPPAPGLDPDAMSYVGAGQSLAGIGRLRIPDADWWDADSTSALAQFPAGFPITIAAGIGAGLAPVQAARVVEALSAFGLVVVIVLLLDGTAGAPAGLLATLLLAATPAVFDNYIRILSEPLFLLLLALTLAAMTLKPERPWLAGLFGALAELVRYSGVALGVAAVLWSLGRGGAWRARIERALEAALPIVAVRTWWTVRLHSVGARAPGFDHLQRGVPRTLREGARTIAEWLTPSVGNAGLRWCLAVAALVAAFWLLRRTWARMPRDGRATARRRLFNGAGLIALCYAAVLLVSRGFVGAGIPFDERLLSPLFLLATIALAACVRIRWPAWSGGMRAGTATVLVLWAIGGALVNLDQFNGLREDGWGYSGSKWQPSAEQHWLRTEGRRYPLFSNNPMLVYFLTGRPSRELPDTADAETIDDFAGTLEERHGAVVGFDENYRRMDPPEFLAAVLGLKPIARFEHMTVWIPEEQR
jgi:hypothetical protein